jgi:hypothetical protein
MAIVAGVPPGGAGSLDGPGPIARFSRLGGIAIDASGSIYVSDDGNSTIRKLDSSGIVTTIAGATGQPGFADGAGSSAKFGRDILGGIGDVVADAAGNVYVAGEMQNVYGSYSGLDWVIRKYDSSGTEEVTTSWPKVFSGGMVYGSDKPHSIAIDGSDNIYVAGEVQNVANSTSGQDWMIRKFDSSGNEDVTGWNKILSATASQRVQQNSFSLIVAGVSGNDDAGLFEVRSLLKEPVANPPRRLFEIISSSCHALPYATRRADGRMSKIFS